MYRRGFSKRVEGGERGVSTHPTPLCTVHLARELQSARLVVFEVSRPAVFNPCAHTNSPPDTPHHTHQLFDYLFFHICSSATATKIFTRACVSLSPCVCVCDYSERVCVCVCVCLVLVSESASRQNSNDIPSTTTVTTVTLFFTEYEDFRQRNGEFVMATN